MADNQQNPTVRASETTIATYLYKLTFGNKIDDPTKEIDQLVFRQGEVKKVTGETTNDVYLATLHGVKINRRIYQPCEIEAEIDFSSSDGNTTLEQPSIDQVKGMFHQRFITLSIVHVNQNVEKQKWVEEGYEYTIAENYYVHELNPQLQRDVDRVRMCVKLNIFSLDKLMTLNKYSKAYVARKLGSGILMPESRSFGYKSNADTPLIRTSVSGMRFLKYQETMTYTDANKKTQTATIPSEFIHPYLVQYNESFYDFLVRTANRFGEFLYYEDGRLILGLSDSGEPFVIDKFETVTAQDVTTGPLAISYYARDSVKNDVGKMEELNFTAIDRDSTGCPDDTFTANLKYNSEIASDEYIFPLYKDKFSTWGYQRYLYGPKSGQAIYKLASIFRDYLSFAVGGAGAVAVPIIKQAIVDEGIMSGMAVMTSNSANKTGEKDYLTPYALKPEQHDDDHTVQFASLSEKGWTTINYYADIHSHEQEQQKKTICINMGTSFIPVKLGQKIKVNGLSDVYVIIQIQQVSEEKWSNDYEKYDSGSSDLYAGQRSLKIYAIPAYVDEKDGEQKFIPPVHPVPIIRKSGPQTAFVIDNNDPKKQGRVRVAYPWQTLKQELKVELAQATEALKEIKDSQSAAVEEEKALDVQIQNLKSEMEALLAYLKMSDADRAVADKADEDRLKALNDKKIQQEKERDAKQAQIDKLKANTEMDASERQKSIEKLEVEKEAIQLEILKVMVEDKEHKIAANQQAIANLERQIADKKEAVKAQKADTNLKSEDNPVYQSLQEKLNQLQEAKKKVGEKKQKASEAEPAAQKRLETAQKELDKVRKDFSTPWIRVATPMATPGGGTYFKPRVGDEVLINYDNDNIERPYVVGSFFSKNNIVPEDQFYRFYNSSINKANISMAMVSPNGHHITFTDPDSAVPSFFTEIVSPGLGFYGPIVANLAGVSGFGAPTKELAGGIHIGDRYGMYEISMASHKRSIDIKSPFGTVNVNAFSGITISAPNGNVKITGKNITLEAGNKIEVKSGTNVAPPSIGKPEGSGTQFGLIVSSGIGAGIKAGNELFGASVVDLSLIRHFIEVTARPVDGTLLLKSRKYLKLEAGLGRALIQKDRYSDKVKRNEKKDENELFFKTVLSCVDYINTQVNAFFTDYQTLWANAYIKKVVYEDHVEHILSDAKRPNIPKVVCQFLSGGNAWDENAILREEDYEGKALPGVIRKDNVEMTTPHDKYVFIKPKVMEYAKACYDLYDHIKKKATLVPMAVDAEGQFNWVKDKVGHVEDGDWLAIQKNAWWDTFKDGQDAFLGTSNASHEQDPYRIGNLKAYKRVMLLTFLHYMAASPENMHVLKGTKQKRQSKWLAADFDLDRVTKDAKKAKYYLTTEFWWKHQIQIMDHYYQHHFGRELWEATFGLIYDTFWKNFRPLETDIWNDNEGGQILFSDKEDRTIEFSENDNLAVKKDANLYSLEHLKDVLKKF